MLLEPLQHNPSLVTWGVVLLEDSISSWEDKRHVRVQLIRNDVQIVRSFHGLFYHNYGSQSRPRERPPKHNTATTSLCMTCYTREEQLFAWQTAYPDTNIDVMNEKSGFIRPGHSSMVESRCSRAHCRRSCDNAWSTEAHEWDVCCTVPYPTISAEMCVPKRLRLDLHCIGLSDEPLSGADFALPTGTVSDVFFFDDAWTTNSLACTAGIRHLSTLHEY
ncbi:hypothetical protein AVEN_85956-1 [Araneus ventricosus]|uniref:Uncharacterized protein n=1 Tax=Araneus ventricosus TaxID=182803 RepID=A0A4Y2G9Q1_ARAVE|nr:hypothetical protein AVEN_85956-1 [Araneus ventricosus]